MKDRKKPNRTKAEDVTLRHFIDAERLDKDESRRVGAKIRAVPKQCFANAAKAVSKLPDYADADYVEGVAVSVETMMPIEHGWIELGGAIIDPTLADDEMAYFPALRFRGPDGVERAKAKGNGLPAFYGFGWGGCECPDLVRAWERAWAWIKPTYSTNAGGWLIRNENDRIEPPIAPRSKRRQLF